MDVSVTVSLLYKKDTLMSGRFNRSVGCQCRRFRFCCSFGLNRRGCLCDSTFTQDSHGFASRRTDSQM